MIQVVLRNAAHPEYGEATIPFPIPEEEYGHCLELLEALEIGNAVNRDCKVQEIQEGPPILKRLEGSRVNLDELDYLAKRLDSFTDQELAQFQSAAVSYDYSNIVDLINLTFSCQEVTVITDFSDLESIGRNHYMTLNGGSARMEELDSLDGTETALLLIESGDGVITPYGVVYDNCMRLSQDYDGRHLLHTLHGLCHAFCGWTPGTTGNALFSLRGEQNQPCCAAVGRRQAGTMYSNAETCRGQRRG